MLGRQLKLMQTDKDIPGISCGLVNNNVFEWEVMLMISDDCRFYGGALWKTPKNTGQELVHSHGGSRHNARRCRINASQAKRLCGRQEHVYGYEPE